MLRRLATLAALLALLAAGCGGDDDGGGGLATTTDGGGAAAAAAPAGADFAPAGAAGFVYVNTDFDGDQWDALRALADKFPDKQKLVDRINRGLAGEGLSFERDIKPALGAATVAAILGFEGENGNGVLLTEPRDEAKLTALIDKLDRADDDPGAALRRTIDGWVGVSDTAAALDAAERANAGASLADDAGFKTAVGKLPGDALFKLYLDGTKLSGLARQRTGSASIPGVGRLSWLTAATSATEGGIRFDFRAKSQGAPAVEEYEPELVSQVPADVLAYLSFNNVSRAFEQVRANPELRRTIETRIGASLDALEPLLAGEGALYVRQGTPLPEVTLVLEVEDEQQAVKTVDGLVGRLAPATPPRTTQVEGVTLKQVAAGQVSLFYGAFDGKLVLSNATTSITGLKGGGDKFADDELWNGAKEDVGMGDSTAGFLYVNLKDTIPVVTNFAQAANQQLPPDVMNNLSHLRTLLLHSTSSEGETSVTGLLGIE